MCTHILLAQFNRNRQFIRMMKYSGRTLLLPLALIGSAMMVASCSMFQSQPESSASLTQQELTAMFKRGKAPQVYGLTAYRTENGALFAGSFRLHEGQVARVDFMSDQNSTTPIIGINENKQLMLIDSSAGESWLSASAYTDMKAVILKDQYVFEKTPRHVYDTLGGIAAVVPQITIDKMQIENSVYYMRTANGPLDMLTRWEKAPVIRGVFGADFLRAFKFVRISLRNRYVVLSATSAYPPGANVIADVPTKNVQGGIGVEAMMDGEKTTALLDLAGDFEIAIDQPASPTMRQVGIGDAVFRKVEVISGYDIGLGTNSIPRIGRQLLEKYDLVLNNFGKQLILELPAK